MAGVDQNGFTIKTLDEITKGLESKLVARLGASFDVSPESPDGQIIGAVAETLSEAWQMGELSYSAFAPSNAFGVGLDNLCELNYVTRYVLRPTQVTLTLTGSNGVIVPVGSIVSDDSGFLFATKQTLVLDDTTENAVSAEALETGPHEVLAGTVTTIVTEGIAGWTGVTNPEDGVAGVDREEDPQLRHRRARSVVTTGDGHNESLYSVLYGLGASYVVVIDNDSGATIDGQPTATLQCIVEGGSQVEIAEAIFSKKPYGIRAYGDIETTVMDEKGHPKVVGFSRTSRIDVFVEVDFVRKTGSAFDSEVRIQQAIVEYINQLDINTDVVWSDIFEPITEAVDFISISKLVIGLSANPTLTADLPMGIKQRARTDIAKVVINDLTP